MSDITGSIEGLQPPSRHRSPPADNPRYHYENVDDIASGSPDSVSYTRRRPSRTSSGAKSSPLSSSPPYADERNEKDKKTKAPRNTLKKLPRRDSHHNDTLTVAQVGQGVLEEDGSTVGYNPRLGQIREGKTSTHSRRRGSSTASSTAGPKALRRRNTEDNAVSRSRVQRKHGSLQQRVEGLAKHSDPSLISLVSGVTQLSSASSGSSSTVIQKPYPDYSIYEEPQARNYPTTAGTMESPALAKMNAAQSEVFQYLQADSTTESFAPTDLQGMPPSTIASSSSSSSSGDTRHDDGLSSITGGSQHATDSATTSPASTRTSNHAGSCPPAQEYRKFKKPLYASSFVHGPGGKEGGEEEDSESESEEDDSSETDSNEERKAHVHAPEVPIEATPLRVPSAASRQSDSHARRLKQQERELANHILQSPQPQKEFQFGAGPSAHVYPPMAIYSPQAYSATSPASVNVTANPPTNWPPMSPMAHFPPPLAIGYATHQSPEAAHAYPLAVRPPMGAPEGMVQHMPPPFPPLSVQPPLYQQHAPPLNHTRPTVVGYELLANELSGSSKANTPHVRGIVPMYRKFEHLNHRVLLHLQDETCELEEELRHLDECIAQMSPRDAEGYAYPASRRNDARYGSEMHFKRTELLGRIFQKLEQYNRALSAFSKLSRDLSLATAEDIQTYRDWMDEQDPIDFAESQFIERDDDLVVVSPKASTTRNTSEGAGELHQSAAVWFPLTLVLPLMAFAIVPSLLGRVVVIVLIVVAEMKIVSETPELRDFMGSREWSVAASVYFGLNMLVAALVR